MRKTFSYGLLVLVSGMFFFLSCQKSSKGNKEDLVTNPELLSTITVIYERQGNPDVDPSMFGDHIKLIETISANDAALLRYKVHTDWVRFVSRNVDANGVIRRYTFDNSPAQIIEIPLITAAQGESVLIYSTKDTCLFTVGTLEALTNGNLKFSYQNVDKNLMYYNFEVNSQNKIGNFIADADIPFESTWSAFGSRAPGPTCQQQFPNSWNKCMNCSYNECYSSWLCGIACSMGTGIALGCAAAFALHCANIGNPS